MTDSNDLPKLPQFPVPQNDLPAEYSAKQSVLDLLEEDDDLMQKLLDLVKFVKTKHSIHDDDRPCGGECDDCYSGDTEFDFQNDTANFFKELADLIPAEEEGSEAENASDDDE